MTKLPHPVLSIAWLVWYGCVLAALARPDSPLFGLVVLLVFLPIEAIGVFWDSGSRDTLSEITTYVFGHKLSKHRRFGQGWNALLLIVVLTIAWLLGRTIAHYSGSRLLAVLVGGLTIVWLDNHFRDPVRHG